MPNYLTYQQIAERLHVKIDSVRYWVTTGRLRAYKPGRHPLVKESDLLAFVEAGATAAPSSVEKRRAS